MSEVAGPGKVFAGRYELSEEIGSGGSSRVWRAHDRQLGRDVAVKVLSDAKDEARAREFVGEARAMASVRDDRVARIYDCGRDAATGSLFVVEELANGWPLDEVMNRAGGVMSPERAAGVASQVAAALSAIHARGITHNDVKPRNVIICRDGRVKLVDFGIAGPDGVSPGSRPGLTAGSVAYMSPEAAQGKPTDERSDVYSLGCMLYEMLSGRAPFDDGSAHDVMRAQVSKAPANVTRANPNVDDALGAIVMRCLAKDPAARYQKASDLRSDLNAWRAGSMPARSGETTVLPTVATQATKVIPVKRAERPGDGLSGATKPLAPRGIPYVQTPPQGLKYTPEEEERRRRKAGRILLAVGCAVVACGLTLLILSHVGKDDGATSAADGVTGTYDAASAAYDIAQTSTEKGQIPDVSGMTRDAAEDAIKAAGFKVKAVETAHSADVESGRAIGTSPDGEAPLGLGVTLTMSDGKARISPSDLSSINEGATEDTMLSQLETLGLKGQHEPALDDWSSTVEKGCFLRFDAAATDADADLEQGDTVLYGLSKGTDPSLLSMTIGNYEGMSFADASSQLSQGGVTAVRAAGKTNTHQAGYVEGQSMPAGSSIARGSSIELYVSDGSAHNKQSGSSPASGQSITNVPQVYGMSAADAQSALSRAGLIVSNVVRQSSDMPDGTAIGTEPASGSPIGSAVSVTLYVSSGPAGIGPDGQLDIVNADPVATNPDTAPLLANQ